MGQKKQQLQEKKEKAIVVDRAKDRITKEDFLAGFNKKNVVKFDDDDDFPDLGGDEPGFKAQKKH